MKTYPNQIRGVPWGAKGHLHTWKTVQSGKIQEFDCLVQTGFQLCWIMTCVFAPLLNSCTDSSPNLCECHLRSGQRQCVVEGTDNPPVWAPPVAPPTGALTDVWSMTWYQVALGVLSGPPGFPLLKFHHWPACWRTPKNRAELLS